MIPKVYIRWFQFTGTSGLLAFISLSARIPLEAKECSAPCYLRSLSWPCPSSSSTIGGRALRALPPTRFFTRGAVLPQLKMGALTPTHSTPSSARTNLPPLSDPTGHPPPPWYCHPGRC